jgi:hypothetical protein
MITRYGEANLMPVRGTNRRTFIAGLGSAAAWPNRGQGIRRMGKLLAVVFAIGLACAGSATAQKLAGLF